MLDKVAEPLRLELEENRVNDSLATRIIETGNKLVQDLLIDNKTVRKVDLQKLAELGATQGIKKKALQKLSSKAFKNNL